MSNTKILKTEFCIESFLIFFRREKSFACLIISTFLRPAYLVLRAEIKKLFFKKNIKKLKKSFKKRKKKKTTVVI